jgi:hypothetical protein
MSRARQLDFCQNTTAIDELRKTEFFFEQMHGDIINAPGLSAFCNGITHQTKDAIQNICFGISSLLSLLGSLYPGATVFLGNITSDYNERHFSNLRSTGAKKLNQTSRQRHEVDVLMRSACRTWWLRRLAVSIKPSLAGGKGKRASHTNFRGADSSVFVRKPQRVHRSDDRNDRAKGGGGIRNMGIFGTGSYLVTAL